MLGRLECHSGEVCGLEGSGGEEATRAHAHRDQAST